LGDFKIWDFEGAPVKKKSHPVQALTWKWRQCSLPKTLKFACHHVERMADRLAVGGHLLKSSTCQLYIELVMLLIKYPASQHEPKMYTRCTHRSCMYRQEIDTI
jgi:hypothetical protein